MYTSTKDVGVWEAFVNVAVQVSVQTSLSATATSTSL